MAMSKLPFGNCPWLLLPPEQVIFTSPQIHGCAYVQATPFLFATGCVSTMSFLLG